MNNEKLMRRYLTGNVVIGFILLIMIFVYQGRFVGNLFVQVERGLFVTTMSSFFEDFSVFNSPLIAFVIILLFQVFVWWFLGKDFKSEKTQYNEAAIINVVISAVLLLGQVLFVFLIPTSISGVVRDMVIFTEFPSGGGEITYAINITYFITFVMVVYNLLVLVQTREPKERDVIDQVEEEENLLREFLKD